MPLLRRQEEAHVCPRPSENMSGLHYGAVWECDECGQQWFLGDDQRDGKFWKKLEREHWLPSNRTPPPERILATALRIDALRDGPGYKLVDSPELAAELNRLEEDVAAYRAARLPLDTPGK